MCDTTAAAAAGAAASCSWLPKNNCATGNERRSKGSQIWQTRKGYFGENLHFFLHNELLGGGNTLHCAKKVRMILIDRAALPIARGFLSLRNIKTY